MGIVECMIRAICPVVRARLLIFAPISMIAVPTYYLCDSIRVWCRAEQNDSLVSY